MDIRLVMEGASSDCEPVVSGVPQGTVLGPVLFLLYINDLSDVAVHSTARLFADDCIVYRPIRNNDDTILLQNDLNNIAEWEFMWQMQFNIDKCFILRVGHPKHKLLHLYTLHNQNLSETDSAKYLGVTITSDLQWNQHINNITNKANSILGLLRRNLRIPSQTIKTHAYQSFESSKTKSVYICLGTLYCVRFLTIAFFTVCAILTYSPPGVLAFPCGIVCNSNTALLDLLDCTLSNIVVRRLYDLTLCKTL